LKFSAGYITGYLREAPLFTQEMMEPGQGSDAATQVIAQLPLDGHQITAQVDLKQLIAPNTFLKAGVKISDGIIENFATYDTISRQPPRRNQALSDSLSYDERVFAGYLSLQRDLGKFNLQGGMRAEQTVVTTGSIKAGRANEFTYLNWFPNLSLSYNGGKNFRGTLGFSSALSRPNYLLLNPYVRFLDAFTFQTGNNDLLPELKYRVSFVGNLFQFLNLNLGYLYGKDYVNNVRTLEADGVTTRISPENAYDSEAWYASVTAYYEAGNNRRFRGQFNFLIIPFQLIIDEAFVDRLPEAPSDKRLNVSTSNSYRLFDDFTLEQSFRYIRGQAGFQTQTFERWTLNLGCRYKLLDEALTVGVRVTDLFNTYNDNGRNFFNGYEANYFSDFNTRRLIISANYNIGKLRRKGYHKSTGEVERFKN
ncbi:MAG: outer membrane beta-barrel family protein, partial [Bacteroidota bacterium]